MSKMAGLDRRVANTKSSAREALITLIVEKGLGNFSVTELCQCAGLNRGTFYNHWKSIDELLEECEQELLEGIEDCVRNFPVLGRNSLKACAAEGKPVSGIVEVFEYMLSQADLLMALTSMNGDGHFVLRLRKSTAQNFLDHIIRGRYGCDNETDEKFHAWFHAAAFLGAVQCWLLDGCVQTPEEMSLKLVNLLYYRPADEA